MAADGGAWPLAVLAAALWITSGAAGWCLIRLAASSDLPLTVRITDLPLTVSITDLALTVSITDLAFTVRITDLPLTVSITDLPFKVIQPT